jgi:hypothetical protein
MTNKPTYDNTPHSASYAEASQAFYEACRALQLTNKSSTLSNESNRPTNWTKVSNPDNHDVFMAQ